MEQGSQRDQPNVTYTNPYMKDEWSNPEGGKCPSTGKRVRDTPTSTVGGSTRAGFTTMRYMQRMKLRPVKGPCCGFSLCEPMWVLFSWLCGQSSTGVLYSNGLCNPSFSSVELLWLHLVLVCGYLCPLPSVVGRQLCEQN